MTTWCLAVAGGGSVDECSRLSCQAESAVAMAILENNIDLAQLPGSCPAASLLDDTIFFFFFVHALNYFLCPLRCSVGNLNLFYRCFLSCFQP